MTVGYLITSLNAVSIIPVPLSGTGLMHLTNGTIDSAAWPFEDAPSADQIVVTNHAGTDVEVITATGDISYANGVFTVTGITHALTWANDLAGSTDSSQTVVGLQGHAVAATAPTNGYGLVWNATASQWQPTALSFSAPITWANDLAGSTTSDQYVVGISGGTGHATVPITTSTLAFQQTSTIEAVNAGLTVEATGGGNLQLSGAAVNVIATAGNLQLEVSGQITVGASVMAFSESATIEAVGSGIGLTISSTNALELTSTSSVIASGTSIALGGTIQGLSAPLGLASSSGLATTGGTYTLGVTGGTTSSPVLSFTGALSTPLTIVLPNAPGLYFVNLVGLTPSSNSVTVQSGSATFQLATSSATKQIFTVITNPSGSNTISAA